MAWYVLYETERGRAVSETSEHPEVMPPGLSLRRFEERPDGQRQMWDETARNFTARPPKVLIDRLQDIQQMTAFKNLPPAARTPLFDFLGTFLGSRRYRTSHESAEVL